MHTGDRNEHDDLEALILDETPTEDVKEDDTRKFHRLMKASQLGDNSFYWLHVENLEKEFDAMFDHKMRALYTLLPEQVPRLQSAYTLLREEYVTTMTFEGSKKFKGKLFASGYRPTELRPSILPMVTGKEYAAALKDKNWFEGPVLAVYVSSKDVGENVELNLSKAIVANLPQDIADVMKNIP